MHILRLVAQDSSIHLRSSPNKSSRSISFQVGSGGGRNTLEIGKRYVFAGEGRAKALYADRILIDFHLTIIRLSALDEKDMAYYRPADEVGQLSFIEENPSSDGLAPHMPAMLSALIFLDDDTFERIEHNLSQKSEIRELTIDANPEGFSYFSTGSDESAKKVLEYGWEPDGSRLMWNIDEASKGPNKLQIKSFDITFSNRAVNDHVHQHGESVIKTLEITLANELRKIRMAVFIIAIAVVVVLIKIWR